LASEVDGHGVANDQVSATDANVPCIYKAMFLPDGRSGLSALWYEGVVVNASVEGEAITRTRLATGAPRFTLERGCIHHRTILSLAESAGVNLPPGNEVGEDSESEAGDE
jgi:hypothetical protein